MKSIVIDPGHGGKFPGAPVQTARNSGIKGEEELTLAIAIEMFHILKERGVIPVLTRWHNNELAQYLPVDLKRRAKIADIAGASVFISLHANSSQRPIDTAEGYEIYHYPDSLEGQRYAEAIMDAYGKAFPAMKSRGIEAEEFEVLRETASPAVLFEMFFANNPEENKWAAEHTKEIAAAICEGLIEVLAPASPMDINSIMAVNMKMAKGKFI